jgi:hypothetical protein
MYACLYVNAVHPDVLFESQEIRIIQYLLRLNNSYSLCLCVLRVYVRTYVRVCVSL